nr:hypothetical protein [Sicyoidochytrium minutum DNA virus]
MARHKSSLETRNRTESTQDKKTKQG